MKMNRQENGKKIMFYGGEYKKTDDFAKVALKKNGDCGFNVFVDGIELPSVIKCSVKPVHPFPSITVEIAMEELTWDCGIALDGLNDGYDNRQNCDQRQKNVDSCLPRNWLPQKVKSRFSKNKPVR